ncbi:hypothetical protein CAPTEDRAFT_194040 [Capitella teleta]|uniref:Uncharacterized protein n=1 Tax=Capitella teleta TaxID=283909 RepID=R7UWC6_CAPTE|nr:hypothetical protein CAPTEDRAFT_194040 [Capitella teleta]|eukprot:ELU10572.1 hypothetical protein CAPTEDRAFT_194040 [Capitella teleta]
MVIVTGLIANEFSSMGPASQTKKKCKATARDTTEDLYRAAVSTTKGLMKGKNKILAECVCDNSNESEWNLFGAWCKCENSESTKYIQNRNKRNKEKLGSIKNGATQTQQVNGSLERFYHYRNSRKYALHYRTFHCLRYQDETGHWLSIAELANRHIKGADGTESRGLDELFSNCYHLISAAKNALPGAETEVSVVKRAPPTNTVTNNRAGQSCRMEVPAQQPVRFQSMSTGHQPRTKNCKRVAKKEQKDNKSLKLLTVPRVQKWVGSDPKRETFSKKRILSQSLPNLFKPSVNKTVLADTYRNVRLPKVIEPSSTRKTDPQEEMRSKSESMVRKEKDDSTSLDYATTKKSRKLGTARNGSWETISLGIHQVVNFIINDVIPGEVECKRERKCDRKNNDTRCWKPVADTWEFFGPWDPTIAFAVRLMDGNGLEVTQQDCRIQPSGRNPRSLRPGLIFHCHYDGEA